MDISVDADIVAAVNTITAGHGGIDVLVNNAGFGMYGAMEDSTLADARYQFEVNLFGMARLTQLALPHMRRQGGGQGHQHLVHGRQDVHPAGLVVPRHQARGGRLERLLAPRAGALWHSGGDHRARCDCHRMGVV